jgi:hypothetical protein
MKRFQSISSLLAVISLLLGVIWLSPVFAAGSPAFAPLGQIRAEGMYVPGAIDLDGSGNLYVADARNGNVYVFDRYGALVKELAVATTGRGLAVTPNGAQLFVTLKQAVAIVDLPTGEISGYLTSGGDPLAEFGLAGEIDLDSLGNIYVADVKDLVVQVYSPAGQFLSSFSGQSATTEQFKQIGGLSINTVDQVVVTDQAGTNGQVYVFTLDPVSLGVSSVVAYDRTSVANFGTQQLYAGLGVAFDPLGRGYILDYVKSVIKVVGPDFGYLVSYPNDPEAKSGRAVGQLSDVYDVVFDATNSRLLVACGSRIEVFGIDGGQSPVYTNYAPTTPVPQSPVAGSVVETATPELVTNNATDQNGDSLSYHFVLKEAGNVVFEAVDVPEGADGTTAVVVAQALQENAEFVWTVQAFDGAMASAVSSESTFVVNAIEEAPSAPELIAPFDGDTVVGLDAFSWGASVDPDPNDNDVSYRIELALDPEFTDVVAVEELMETALTLDSFAAYGSLVNGAAYYWHVVAVDKALDGTVQAESLPNEVRQFVYDTTALTITANMPDAEVSVYGNHAYAGQAIGVAPLELRDLTPGTLSVVVNRAGFEPFVAQVTVPEGESVELYAELVTAMDVNKLNVSRKGINGRSGLSVDGNAAPFLVDFDSDGDLDLLVGDSAGQLSLFSNMRVAGRNRLYFDQGTSVGAGLTGAIPFVADWNNDGLKDLLVGCADGSVKLFVNENSEQAPVFANWGDLQVAGGSLTVAGAAAPAVVDFDGDKDKDLLVGNAAGEVVVFENVGSDSAPELAPAVAVFQATGAVVPFPVDWDADGQSDLMLSANGVVSIYTKVDGSYELMQQFSDRRSDFVAAFPIDLDGSGKQLLAGQVDGQITYLTGKSTEPVASFHLALQSKAAELVTLVEEEAPALADDAYAINALVIAGDYEAASDAVQTLIAALPAGAALQSATELLALL